MGAIAPSLGNLSSLQSLTVGINYLQGSILDSPGQLLTLTFIGLGPNNLVGEIPPLLFNLSSLIGFLVALNKVYDSLPQDIGLNLPKLQVLNFNSNQFSGTIPRSVPFFFFLINIQRSFPNASGLICLEILEAYRACDS
ncbi:unnamed protein product [Camellia sinensis]